MKKVINRNKNGTFKKRVTNEDFLNSQERINCDSRNYFEISKSIFLNSSYLDEHANKISEHLKTLEKIKNIIKFCIKNNIKIESEQINTFYYCVENTKIDICIINYYQNENLKHLNISKDIYLRSSLNEKINLIENSLMLYKNKLDENRQFLNQLNHSNARD